MNNGKFNLVIADDDNKIFNLVEDLYTDELHNSLIQEAQKEGRHVRCFNPNSELKKQVIEEMEAKGYKFTREKILKSALY